MSIFKAKYPGNCADCRFSFEVGEEIHYVEDRLCHANCGANLTEDHAPQVISEGFTVRGRRQPKVCSQCHIEHAGECF